MAQYDISMSRPAMSTFRRLLPTLLPVALILVASIVLLCLSSEARDVGAEAAGLVFTFFSTPFILETSVAVIGLILVLVVNQRRLEKDKDEWVEMEVPARPSDPETKTPVG